MMFDLRRLLGACLLIAIAIAPLSRARCGETTHAAGLDDSIAALALAALRDRRLHFPDTVVALTGTPFRNALHALASANLVAEANAHSGYLGGELDALRRRRRCATALDPHRCMVDA